MDTTPPQKNSDPDRRDAESRDAGTRDAETRTADPWNAGMRSADRWNAGTPERGTPKRGTPKRGMPERGTPERGTPERGTPERGTPERGTPQAERRAPGSGPPGRWDHEAESFGAWLCRHRRVRGIELREIADDSKIGMTYLQAFEDDRFDILPAAVFAKGFLRQYANYVGLNPEEVVNFYLSARREHERDEEAVEPPAERRSRSPLMLVGVTIGVVLAVLILLWFLAVDRGDPAPPARPSAPAADAAAAPAADRAVPTAIADDATAVVAEPAVDPPLRLALDFSGECWVEVAIDGELRIAENKIQGESLVLRADRTIDVKIGDVGVVEAELNGRPFRFAGSPGSKVRSQRIDLDTVAALGDPGGEER